MPITSQSMEMMGIILMRHNLKKKYSWKQRSLHFSAIRIAKYWRNILIETVLSPSGFGTYLSRNIGNDLGLDVESALDGKEGTTSPSKIIVNEPQRYKL